MTGPDAAEDRPPNRPPADVLASLLEGLPLAIFVLAGDGTPVYANAAAEALLGKAAESEVSPENLASVYGAVQAGTGEPYPVERMPIVRALAGETATVDDMELDRPFGTVAVEVWAAPILAADSSVAYAVAAFHDVSERRHAQDRAARLQEEAMRQSRWLTALREIQATVLSGVGRDAGLDLVVRRARELIDGDSTSIGVPDGDGFLAIHAADGQGAASLKGTRFSVTDSIMGEVLGMGAAAVLDDIGCHASLADPVVRLDLGPAVFVPLTADAQVLGSLCVARRRGGALFTEEEVTAAEAFANQAAMAVRTHDAQRESAHLVVDRDRARTAEDLQGVLQSLLSAHESLMEPQAGAWPELPDRPGGLRDVLEELDHVVLRLRSHINALRPATSVATGLQKDLLDLVARYEARTGVVTVLDVDGEAIDALGARAPAVLEIVRQALSEGGSHVAARTCRVRVGRVPEGVVVQIDDDGRNVPGSGTSATVTLPIG